MTVAKTPPHFRCPWEPADALAVQALARGAADKDQQKRVLDWVLYSAGGLKEEAFMPGGNRDTDFFLGRQFVGRQVAKLMSINVNALRKANDNG